MDRVASGTEDVTRLLRAASEGSREAFDRLLPMVYGHLRAIANNRLRAEAEDHTLNTTALVHEAYIKLVDQDRVQWQSRSHFFAIAAQAMRRILVDHAKASTAQKRGSGAPHVSLTLAEWEGASGVRLEGRAEELIALDDALDRLSAFNPRGAQVVEARFFGGLSYDEIATVLGTSPITVRRAWMVSKAWLGEQLR